LNYKRIVGIYLITRKNVLSKDEPEFYIGKSNNIKEGIFGRLNEHCNNSIPTQKIDKSIKEYGVSAFTFEILEELKGKNKKIDKREQFWIKKFIDQYGEKKLYNSTIGGIKGSTRISKNLNVIDKKVINKIKEILNKELDFSIYLLAEKFNLKWTDIVTIRKPFV
jgi:group I intron endonuclease